MSSPVQRNNGVKTSEYDEYIGPNLSHIKSSGGMTISPELFEKVRVGYAEA